MKHLQPILVEPNDPAELERLSALYRYQVLDTLPAPTLERIARLVSRALNAPVALINFIDAERQWSKTSSDGSARAPIARDVAFCSHTIYNHGVTVIPDTHLDERFKHNPVVTGPERIRFYAGAPLHTSDGYNIGALCIVDASPRTLSPEQETMLLDFAALVMDELELRLRITEINGSSVKRGALLTRERLAREELSNILERTTEAFFAVDNEWRFTFMNQPAEQLFGHSRGTLLGRNLWEEAPQTLGKSLSDQFHHAMSTQAAVIFEEWSAIAARWYEVRAYPSLNGLSVYVRDITASKAAEATLILRDRAIEATSNGIVITDPFQPSNPIVYCNPAFERMTGYTQAEVIGHNCRFLQGPETDPVAVATIRAALAAGRECQVNLVNYRKDGTALWNKLAISPIYDTEGSLTHSVGVQTDITARIQAEQALTQYAGMLREQAQLLDLAYDAILVHDIDHSAVKLWNSGAESMYGWSKGEAIGANAHGLLRTEASQPLDEIAAEVLRTGQWEGELTQTRKDGTTVIVTSRWALQRNVQGEPSAILEINRDITERKRADAERAEHLAREQTARVMAEEAGRRLSFLDEASDVLAKSLDRDTIVRTTAELVTARMADICMIDLVLEGRDTQRVIIRHANAEKQAIIDVDPAFNQAGALPWAELVTQVLETGQPVVVAELLSDWRAAPQHNGTSDELLRQLESTMLVPLITRAEVVGVLSFIAAGSGRRYTRLDLQMAQELARRVSQALDNARLYRDGQSAIQRKDEALALLNTLLISAPAGFAFFDPDLRYQLINERLAETNGHSVCAHIGRTVTEMIPHLAAEVEPLLRKVLQTGEPVVEATITVADTRHPVERHWLTSYYPVHGSGGQLLGVGAVIVEVTASRQMEAALSRSEAQLAGVINSTMDAIITVDDTQCIRLFNHAAEKMFGWTAGELIGQSLQRLLPERFRAAHARHIPAFGATCVTTRSMESPGVLSALRSDGTEFPIEASISQIEVAGQKLYTVILRDITERKKLEAQLLQSQKMESIGRLAGGVAHDFNNLLMGMMGYANLALDGVEPNSELHDDLAEICKAASKAATLTHQLLAFARKQVIEPRVLNLNDVLLDIDKMLRRLIGADIELVILPAHRLRPVRVDPCQLQQILVNLAVNARDAMPAGGKLIIETSEVAVDAASVKPHVDLPLGRYVCLKVSDTGHGMDETVQQHLFEPFFTTKEPGKGTGLGLATCYGIVKQHGGYISVDSALGKGSTFTLYFPLVTKGGTGILGGDDTEALPQGHETVLLVEDEPAVRALTSRVMQQQGYTVVEASNGAEALRMLNARDSAPIHLVLSDMVMPQMGGGQLVEQLRQLRPDIKVLLMSGYTDHNIGRDSLVNVNFLQKPFLPAVLARKVREVLES